jgi:hypothetical protein
MEDDVLSLIERILQTHLETGEQVRIFSFNERPKKIFNGVGTISTCFSEIGKIAWPGLPWNF